MNTCVSSLQTVLFIVALGATCFPNFKVKRENYIEEITREEVAMPLLHLFAKGAQVLNAGLPLKTDILPNSSAWMADF